MITFLIKVIDHIEDIASHIRNIIYSKEIPLSAIDNIFLSLSHEINFHKAMLVHCVPFIITWLAICINWPQKIEANEIRYQLNFPTATIAKNPPDFLQMTLIHLILI